MNQEKSPEYHISCVGLHQATICSPSLSVISTGSPSWGIRSWGLIQGIRDAAYSSIALINHSRSTWWKCISLASSWSLRIWSAVFIGLGLGVFGLEDATEQGPVHSPRRNGFGAVGAVAVHALLADVDLPAAEIGGGWFHGLGVGGDYFSKVSL